MKKIILPAFACVLLLASCKKDYTCECTQQSVYSAPSGSETYTSSSNTTYAGVTKKFVQDKAECYSAEYNDSYESFVGYDVNFNPIYETVNVTVTNTCTISK
jgi:hypothetical protein